MNLKAAICFSMFLIPGILKPGFSRPGGWRLNRVCSFMKGRPGLILKTENKNTKNKLYKCDKNKSGLSIYIISVQN